MRSPFPGMDPFIESQSWPGFHSRMINVISELLMLQLGPGYVCEIEKTIYLMTDGDDIQRHLVPDVSVIRPDHESHTQPYQATDGGVATLKPTMLTLPEELELEQSYLAVRVPHGDVVTVIELLSPWNKSPGDGQLEYLQKRHEYRFSPVSFVEIDLLRGGRRLPLREELPAGDYHAFVTRRESRRQVAVYSWGLRDDLPVLPVPLKQGDADVALKLQEALSLVFERARYDRLLNYDLPVKPPLSDDDQTWVAERVKAWKEDV